jgi:hypothetical protein
LNLTVSKIEHKILSNGGKDKIGEMDKFKRKLLEYFRRDELIVQDIIATLKLPILNTMSHLKKIPIGAEEKHVRDILSDYILREDTKPLEEIKGEIDSIISVNAWPEIYRYIFAKGKLVACIIEIGIYHTNFSKVFRKLEDKITEIFSHSITGNFDEKMKYPQYSWEYANHFCYMQVINDKEINLNPILIDYHYYPLDGTFIRTPKKMFRVLPTIAVIFTKDKKYMVWSFLYLQYDLSKRLDFVSWFNEPFMFEK